MMGGSSTAVDTKTVLVIDDDAAIVKLIEQTLELRNFKTITATQWTDAIDALNRARPDLVLLDLKMPTVNGDSLLEFMREQGYQTPVIVVSAHLTGEVASRLEQFGVRAFVWKPFKVGDLLDEVEKAVSDDPEQISDGPALSENLSPAASEPDGNGSGINGREPEAASSGPADPPAYQAFESGPETATTADANGHEWVPHASHGHRTRRRHTSRHARRKTWVYLGVITFACLILASSIALTQRYFAGADPKAKIRQSLQDQIVKDMVRQRLLEESQGTK